MTAAWLTSEDVAVKQRLKLMADDPTTFGTALGLIFVLTHRFWGGPPLWAAALPLNFVGVGGIGIALSLYVRDQNRTWGLPAIFSLAKPRVEVVYGLVGHILQAVVGTYILLH